MDKLDVKVDGYFKTNDNGDIELIKIENKRIRKYYFDAVDEEIIKRHKRDNKNVKKLFLGIGIVTVYMTTLFTVIKKEQKGENKPKIDTVTLSPTPIPYINKDIKLVINNFDEMKKEKDKVDSFVDSIDYSKAYEEIPYDTCTIEDLATKIEPNVENDLEDIDTNVGSKKEEMLRYLTEEDAKLFEKYASMYNVPKSILQAMAYQESSFNSGYESNYAKGLFSIENTMNGEKVQALNYNTNQYDTITINDNNRMDKDSSVQIVAMMMQGRINRYFNYGSKYNPNAMLLVIQSYNYSTSVVDKVLEYLSDKKGLADYKDAINLPKDEIIDAFKYLHDNPKQFLPNWGFKTYGDGEYYNHVIRYLDNPIINCNGVELDMAKYSAYKVNGYSK